jgi:hypothetical protein
LPEPKAAATPKPPDVKVEAKPMAAALPTNGAAAPATTAAQAPASVSASAMEMPTIKPPILPWMGIHEEAREDSKALALEDEMIPISTEPVDVEVEGGASRAARKSKPPGKRPSRAQEGQKP